MPQVKIGLLGPIAVTYDGEPVPFAGRQAQTILSMLAANAGLAVSTEQLIDALWLDDVPSSARKAVQVYISRMRKSMGGDDSPILSVPNGYSVSPDRADIDLAKFEQLIAEASRQDAAAGVELLTEAVDLWRGRPFGDLDAEPLRAHALRLQEARLAATEQRIGLQLKLGRHGEVLSDLESLTLEHPLREGLRSQQMLAMYRSGRQAEALRVYSRTRDLLAEELGLDPSQDLQDLESKILDQSPELDLVSRDSDASTRTTFLVTDLVDSTALWESDPDAMGRSLARHDEILQQEVAAGGGAIFKTTGDGIFATMPSIDAAAKAATTIQKRFGATVWEPGALAVRVAIDEGVVDQRDGDYFGPALNRACRLMASAHGGQILAPSQHVGELPQQTVDLGPHDYKGIGRVEVKQVVVGEAAAEHPELRTERGVAPTPRHGFDHTVRGYELRERLGEGDFGIVYRAYQATIGREVAIKVIRPEYANRSSFIRQFEVEAQLVAQIEHPHVVSLYDYWRDADGAYLVMRWLRGGSLRTALGRGPLNASAAMRLIDQVGSALASAHRQGVVHRDIKPANVLLDDEGNAYLSDFGIAARHVDTVGGPLSTSPAYVSPEEVAGKPSTPLSDIYALGMLGFEVLTAARPGGDGPRARVVELRPELSPAIDVVLDKATAANPEDRYQKTEDFLRAMRQALGADVVAIVPDEEPDADIANPYRGLRAFQETDADQFFGRDALIDELVEAVEQRSLVAVVGPSGSGKSSVVRAGLLPRLRRSTGDPWFVTDMFPGSYPFEELEGALSRVATNRREDIAEDLRSDDLGLVRAVKKALPNDDSRLLLVIDQFEELFSLTTDDAARNLFIANLTAAANDSRGRLTVVVTIRADFFHHPLGYGEFGNLLRDSLVTVAMPTQESLALAVSKPARAVGLDLEPGLVNEVVRDVADEPGGLPLMQHALSELFDRRQGNTLYIEDYQASGGVLGSLARRADDIYAGLGPSAQAAARQIFLRMVRTDETADDTRRRVRLSELHALGIDRAEVEIVLQEFGQFRLLSFDRDPITRGPTVEVSHEALIREWGSYRDWIDERREDLLLERRLDASMQEWETSGQDEGFLLSEGRLAQYEDWASGTDVRLTTSEDDYILASRNHTDAAITRTTRRRHAIVGVLAAFALLASGLAVFALAQRNDAQDATALAEDQAAFAAEESGRANDAAVLADERRAEAELTAAEARALQLVALASESASTDPELAINFALEAHAVASDAGLQLPDVQSVLYRSTFQDRVVRRFTNETSTEFFFMSDLINAVNAQGTQGLWPQPEINEFGLYPLHVDVVDLSTGSVLTTISDPSGLSSYEWDFATGALFVATFAGELRWLDPVSFDVVRTLNVPGGLFGATPHGGTVRLDVVTDQGTVDLQTHLIDVDSGDVVFSGPPDAFFSQLSPSGDYVSVLDDFRFLRIYDTSTGDAVSVIEFASGGGPESWTWAADRDVIWRVNGAGDLREYDPADGSILREVAVGPLSYIVPSPDGQLIAATGLATGIELIDATTFATVETLKDRVDFISEMSWSQDSRTLVTGDETGTSTVWDLGEATTAPRSLPAIRTAQERALRLDFLENSGVFVGGVGGEGERFDLDDGSLGFNTAAVNATLDTYVIASPDQRVLAVPQPNDALSIVDAETGGSLSELPAGTGIPRALSHDGSLVLTRLGPAPGVLDHRDLPADAMKLVDVESGGTIFVFEPTDRDELDVITAEFAADGTLITNEAQGDIDDDGVGGEVGAITNYRSYLAVRDAETFEVLSEVALDANTVEFVVSADGNLLAFQLTDGELQLFDLQQLKEGAGVDALIGSTRTGSFAGLAFSADGKMILSVAADTITAYSADAELAILWTIDLEGQAITIRVVDGYVWTSMVERLHRGRSAQVGLVGFPLDLNVLVDHAASRRSRPMTDDECRQHLGVDTCADRAFQGAA